MLGNEQRRGIKNTGKVKLVIKKQAQNLWKCLGYRMDVEGKMSHFWQHI